MADTRALLDVLATHLATAGVGTYVRDQMPADPEAVAITTGWLPERASLVVLDATVLRVDNVRESVTYALRVRCRSTETDDGGDSTDSIADACFDALNGVWSRQMHGLHVESIAYSGTGSVTYDAGGRMTRTDPYAVTVQRPVANH